MQTHEKHDNSMIPRTTGAIALRPTGNAQGGRYFYSLTTGRRLNRNHWTVLPIPADVVQRVNRLSRRPLGLTALEFANRAGVPLLDDGEPDDDNTHDADDDVDDDDDDNDFDPDADDDMIAGVEHDEVEVDYDEATAEEVEQINNDNLAILDNVNNLELELELEMDGDGAFDIDDEQEAIDDIDDDDVNARANVLADADSDAHEPHDNIDGADELTNDTDDDVELDVDAQTEAKYGPRTGKYDLRARKPRDYGHMHVTLEAIAMTQHSVQKGLKLFGEAGVVAVTEELVQLHERGVVEPKYIQDLNGAQKQAALQYLMFLKQKRNGSIKGRGCADGRKQRSHTTKEEASSPTVAIESVMLSCTIDAKEKRDVATVDIRGAFMQADMEDEVHMKLEGKMAELMVRVDPKLYRKFVQIERGRKVLYVKLKKALYGTLKAALLFRKRLSSQLKNGGSRSTHTIHALQTR